MSTLAVHNASKINTQHLWHMYKLLIIKQEVFSPPPPRLDGFFLHCTCLAGHTCPLDTVSSNRGTTFAGVLSQSARCTVAPRHQLIMVGTTASGNSSSRKASQAKRRKSNLANLHILQHFVHYVDSKKLQEK